MSNPILIAAQQWLSVPTEDQDPATTFAKAFMSEHERVAELERRVAEVNKRNNALVHENADLRSKHTDVVQAMKREPEYTRHCINGQCETVLIREVAPPDDAIEAWLHGLGWRNGECPECARGKG
jgi:hypothetical protein